MSEETQGISMSTRVRLSAMMFFQYMLVAVWFVQLSAYLVDLEMSGTQMAWIVSSMALGCLGSPLIGMFADRHFASQGVLAVLNLLTAALLVGAAMVTTPGPVFIMLLLAMLCYMPTWGLTSAIAMSHSPSDKFPQIRVFGSIGWVAAGLFSLVAINIFSVKVFDGTAIPLYCGAAVALLAALHAMILPHTPPPAKGQKASVADALGLRSLSLMKDVQVSVLVIGALLATIPFSAYWSYCSAFLKSEGFKYLTVTMGWGQVVEMGLILLVPVALRLIGLKWTMVIGLAAMLVRYVLFTLGSAYGLDSLYFGGIFVHGIIFGFFYVGAQIYIDRKAPKEMKAQAQGLIFLVSFGAGLLIGNHLNGALLEMGVAEGGAKNYHLMWTVSMIVTAVLLVLFAMLFRDPVAARAAEKKTDEIGETEPPAEPAPAMTPAEQAVAPDEAAPAEPAAEQAPVADDWADAAADTAASDAADTMVDEPDEPDAAADTAVDEPDEPDAGDADAEK